MIAVTRRYRFSASHRLHAASLSGEENARLYGKCNHPFGHGHDYRLEVTMGGQVDPLTGLLLPVAVLDHLVQRRVLSLFASRNINLDVPCFAELVPTTENIVTVIAQLLQDSWDESIGSRASLRRVYVQETGRNTFEILVGDSSALVPQKVLAHAESKIV